MSATSNPERRIHSIGQARSSIAHAPERYPWIKITAGRGEPPAYRRACAVRFGS
jgi:hypothetical protein